jgi:hypothetical protein
MRSQTRYDQPFICRRYLWRKRRIAADVSARVCFHYNRFRGFIRAWRVKSHDCIIEIAQLPRLNDAIWLNANFLHFFTQKWFASNAFN